MNAPEQRLLSADTTGPQAAVAGGFRTGMTLPYSAGQSWSTAGGPHGWSGSAAPWSSLDLAGGDQIVRAVRAGTDVTCGGSALGRHVHLGFRHNDAYIRIAGHNLSKWVLQNGGSAYQGSALHGSRRVATGGTLYNYGVPGFTQGIVDTDGGTSHTGRWGTSAWWHRLGDGTWISDAYVWTGGQRDGRRDVLNQRLGRRT